MIRTAGWIFVVLGTAHTVLSLAMVVSDHTATWLNGGLWRAEGGFTDMIPAMAAYWFTLASFGVPLLVIGLTVLWIDRCGIVPPAFAGWILLAWALVNTGILPLSPWILAVVGSVLYLVGVRRASSATEPVAAQAV